MVQLLAAFFPAAWLSQPWLQSLMAVVLTLAVLYVVGRVTSLVIGRQAFSLFEALLERLPFVAKVYTSVRQLIDTMMAKKETSQRVVLVDFPIAGQKSIGFLTRTLTDSSHRRAAGRGAAAERHQSHLGVSAILAAGSRDGDRPDHGTGDEHADDGRSGGAGDNPFHAGPAVAARPLTKIYSRVKQQPRSYSAGSSDAASVHSAPIPRRRARSLP